MTIESASTFLVGSILVSLGFLVVISVTILVNNLIAKYWKPIKLWTWEYKFVEMPVNQEEPKLDPVAEKQQTKK
jgi:hypothetical protein